MTMEAPAEILVDVQRTRKSRCDFLPDRSGVLVTLPGPLPAQFTASLLQIEEQLLCFGLARAGLQPSVAEGWPSGQIVHARSPAVLLETSVMTGEALLHIRDDGFGWLHYALSRKAARSLGESLIALADGPMPEAGSA
jgi:hypothetical protein